MYCIRICDLRSELSVENNIRSKDVHRFKHHISEIDPLFHEFHICSHRCLLKFLKDGLQLHETAQCGGENIEPKFGAERSSESGKPVQMIINGIYC